MSKPVELVVKGEGQDTPLAKKVVDSIRIHQQLMGLDDWYGVVEFKQVDEEEGGDTMETEAWPQYKKFEITVDLKSLENSPEYLHFYTRHEMSHVLTWTYFGIAEELCYKRAKGAIRKLDEATVGMLEHMPLWDTLYETLGIDTKISS